MALKIIFDQKSCIGAGECETLSREFWKVNNKGKAELSKSSLNPKTGNYELVVDEKAFEFQRKVAGSCPVGCIRCVRE